MSQPVDTNISKETVQPEEKSDIVERDLSLDKLLKLSKLFKNGVDTNLNKFKEEKMLMINEISGMNCSVIPNVLTDGTIKHEEKQSHQKLGGDNNFLCRGEISETFISLEQELKNEKNSLVVQNNEDEYQNKDKCYTPCIQYNNEKTNYIKKIFEVENEYLYWMDKYNELHNKYSQLELKCIQIEKENCNYQMELARIQIIENENLRLNQIMDKSNQVRKELELALESCHEVVDKYKIDTEVARIKVKEAIEVVEKTYSEKDRLVKDLNISNEELVKLEMTLKNLTRESVEKVNFEVEKIKTIFKTKLREANVKIEFLRTEKQIECNKTHKMSRECEILNKKYALLNQKYTDEHDAFSKKVAFLVQQIKEYEVTLANLTADVKSLKETNIKLQKRKRCSEDSVEEKNMQINELTKHIEAHKQIVNMWRIETHDIIEGFKHKINQLKQHCSKLNKKNIKLKQILYNSKPNYLTLNKKRKPRKLNKSSDNLSISNST